jgi:hypothetical protein
LGPLGEQAGISGKTNGSSRPASRLLRGMRRDGAPCLRMLLRLTPATSSTGTRASWHARPAPTGMGEARFMVRTKGTWTRALARATWDLTRTLTHPVRQAAIVVRPVGVGCAAWELPVVLMRASRGGCSPFSSG